MNRRSLGFVLGFVYQIFILASAQQFEGSFLLAKVERSSGEAVPIPKNRNYPFSMKLQSTRAGGSVYSFFLRIGNNIRGNIEIDEATGKIMSVSKVSSTKMMPSQVEYNLELAVIEALRNLEAITQLKHRLILSGSQGSIILKNDIRKKKG